MASKKVAKQVQVIARVQFKCDSRKVVYLVRASNGTDQYETTVFDGKATSCTCKAKGCCYHMRGVEALESKRQEIASQFAAKSAPSWMINLVQSGKIAKIEANVSTTIQAIESAKAAEIAQSLDIAIEEVEKIAVIAAEHKAAMAPKHTNVCKPIGPHDTKKDWTKAALTRNTGFSILK